MGARGLILAVVFMLLGAAPAMATVRYAAPSGTDSTGDCTNAAAPCTIAHAFNDVMTNGDELVLAPGDYGSASAPAADSLQNASDNVTVHAQAGQRARIFLGFALILNGTDPILRDVEVDSVNGTIQSYGTLERVIGRSSMAQGCSLTASAIIDTLCVGTTGVGGGAYTGGGTRSVTLRNVTAIGTAGDGIDFNGGDGTVFDVSAVNVIARGTITDVLAENSGPSSGATITLSHSNYATFQANGTNSSVAQSADGGNQTQAPQFVNAGAGDYQEAAGSPTIDAGLTDPANGAFDLDGNARTLGASTDIGAYEFVPPTGVPSTTNPSGAPAISGLTVSKHRVSVAGRRVRGRCVKPSAKNKRHKACRLAIKLTVFYALSKASAVSVRLVRQSTGRTVNGKCVQQTKKNLRHKKCTLMTLLPGSISLTGKAGQNSFVFAGRIGGRSIGIGTYYLVLAPAGGAAAAVKLQIVG